MAAMRNPDGLRHAQRLLDSAMAERFGRGTEMPDDMPRPWDQAAAAGIMDRVAIDVLCWALGHEHYSSTGAQLAS